MSIGCGVFIVRLPITKISKNDALNAMDRLAKDMWRSVGVYEDARKAIEKAVV